MKDQIIGLIDQYAPPRIRDDLRLLVQNSIRLITHPVDESELSTGTSKMGGAPDLPPNIEWPRWKELPLSFIAQLNMNELAEYDLEAALPGTGIAYFFCDTIEYALEPGSWQVFYYDDMSSLFRTPIPADLPERDLFSPCAVQCSTEATIPSWDYAVVRQLLTFDEWLEIGDDYRALEEKVYELRGGSAHSDGWHRVLGWTDDIQGDMQLSCQLASHGINPYRAHDDRPQVASLKAGTLDWRLLLQVDTDYNTGMQWGDVGTAYFWIRQQDLQARKFGNVWFVTESY